MQRFEVEQPVYASISETRRQLQAQILAFLQKQGQNIESKCKTLFQYVYQIPLCLADDEKTIVPVENDPAAIHMILIALDDKRFDGHLVRSSVSVSYVDSVIHVGLEPATYTGKQRYVYICFANDRGRLVDVGRGPNFYKTFEELKLAILSALNSYN